MTVNAMRKIFAVLLIIGLAACTTEVKRLDVDEDIDLSGRWNDTDSRMVSDAMIEECVNGVWLEEFTETSGGKRPVVIVGAIRNRTSEHINVNTFVKDLERALISSGKVDFVASAEQRDEIRMDRADQAVYASEETAKEHGHELGADFMLKGEVNSIFDKEGKKTVKYYQIDLELIHMETNRKVWIQDKKIKKLVKRKKFGF